MLRSQNFLRIISIVLFLLLAALTTLSARIYHPKFTDLLFIIGVFSYLLCFVGIGFTGIEHILTENLSLDAAVLITTLGHALLIGLLLLIVSIFNVEFDRIQKQLPLCDQYDSNMIVLPNIIVFMLIVTQIFYIFTQNAIHQNKKLEIS